MTDLIRCDICNGRKRILGMGGMEKDCYKCHAIGWTQCNDPIILDKVVNSNGDPVKVKKKPGRKPRLLNRDNVQI